MPEPRFRTYTLPVSSSTASPSGWEPAFTSGTGPVHPAGLSALQRVVLSTETSADPWLVTYKRPVRASSSTRRGERPTNAVGNLPAHPFVTKPLQIEVSITVTAPGKLPSWLSAT